MYCSNCGKEIDDKAVICIHCGCAVGNSVVQKENKKKNKDRSIAVILVILLGEFGLHRFYMDETLPGVLILINTLLCSVFWFLVIPPIFALLVWVAEVSFLICRPKEYYE